MTTKQAKLNFQDTDIKALVLAFLAMKNTSEMQAFLRDLLTESEIIEFSKRFRAARSLAKSIHYTAIAEDTGLSSRTIARVKHWFKHGKGGYRIAIARRKSQS